MFWGCFSRVMSAGFVEQWYRWASKSILAPIVAKPKMLQRHSPSLLKYFKNRLTNAKSEEFTSKIHRSSLTHEWFDRSKANVSESCFSWEKRSNAKEN
jgi:hypothetical protein